MDEGKSGKRVGSPPPRLFVTQDEAGVIHVRPATEHLERKARNERIAASRARLPELLKQPRAEHRDGRIEQLEEQVAALRDILL